MTAISVVMLFAKRYHSLLDTGYWILDCRSKDDAFITPPQGFLLSLA